MRIHRVQLYLTQNLISSFIKGEKRALNVRNLCFYHFNCANIIHLLCYSHTCLYPGAHTARSPTSKLAQAFPVTKLFKPISSPELSK